WPARQRRPRVAPAIGNARQHPRPRPALAQPFALHGSGRRYRACHGKQPVANRDCCVVELVALLLTEKNYQLWPDVAADRRPHQARSEEHTSELQSPYDIVCRLLLEKKKK